MPQGRSQWAPTTVRGVSARGSRIRILLDAAMIALIENPTPGRRCRRRGPPVHGARTRAVDGTGAARRRCVTRLAYRAGPRWSGGGRPVPGGTRVIGQTRDPARGWRVVGAGRQPVRLHRLPGAVTPAISWDCRAHYARGYSG